jgi:hypothetical protein
MDEAMRRWLWLSWSLRGEGCEVPPREYLDYLFADGID